MRSMWSQYDAEFNDVPGASKPSIRESRLTVDDVLNEICNLCETCSTDLVVHDGLYTCVRCGDTKKHRIDRSPEWRFYGSEDSSASGDPSRCGMVLNPLLAESSYGCTVTCRGSMSWDMRRIKRHIEWQCMPYREKAQLDDFQYIQIMATNSCLPKIIVDDAQKYYKMISEEKTYRGANRESILAASVYIACRVNEFPRTAKEISVMFQLHSKNATKGCKNAMNIMNTLDEQADKTTQYSETTAQSFIARYCSRLGMPINYTLLCEFIAIQIQEMRIMTENTPNAVAASILFLVACQFGLGFTKLDIRKASDISEVTIVKCYKKLMGYKNELIPHI